MDLQTLLYSPDSFTHVEHQLLRNLWASLPALQKMEAIDQVLHRTIMSLLG